MSTQKNKIAFHYLLVSVLTLNVLVSLMLVATNRVVVSFSFWLGTAALIFTWCTFYIFHGKWNTSAIFLLLILGTVQFIRFSPVQWTVFFGRNNTDLVRFQPFLGVLLLIFSIYHLFRIAREQRHREKHPDEKTIQSKELGRKESIAKYKEQLKEYSLSSLQHMLSEPHRFEADAVEAARIVLEERNGTATAE